MKPILWTQALADGRRDVKLYISAPGEKGRYKSTGVKILPEEWDEKRARVKKTHPLSVQMNARIQAQVLEVSKHLLQGGTVQSLDKQASGSFLAFTNHFISEAERGLVKLTPGTQKNYRSFRTRLVQWLEKAGRADIRFDEINLEFYFQFRDFLVEECDNDLAHGFTKHVKILKRLMNVSRQRGLHQCDGHEHPEFRKYRAKDSGKIYLTEKEVERMARLDLATDPALERERDRFVVSFYFLLRYSDSVRVRPDSFFQDEEGQYYYRNVAQKTKAVSVIPVKPLVLEILERRGFDLSGDTNQEANAKLKTVAAMAGIDNQVTEGDRTGPKWRFVTTHTARRSAATNLALQNVNEKIIADLGGWQSVQSLRTYLRNTAIESARAVRDLPFFR